MLHSDSSATAEQLQQDFFCIYSSSGILNTTPGCGTPPLQQSVQRVVAAFLRNKKQRRNRGDALVFCLIVIPMPTVFEASAQLSLLTIYEFWAQTSRKVTCMSTSSKYERCRSSIRRATDSIGCGQSPAPHLAASARTS